MVEAKVQVEREEFDAITRRLLARAEGGRGSVRSIPRADAEDVVQDAWEKAVKQKRGLPEGDQLEAHVHQALVDTATDYWRTRLRKREIPRKTLQRLDAEIEEQVRGEDGEEARLAALRAREILRTLRNETDRQVEMFATLAALGYSEREIAEQLRIDEREAGAIRKRFARARPALRAALGQDNDTQKEDI
jgi:RNA polymerase sigma factor (sigma-70 family)